MKTFRDDERGALMLFGLFATLLLASCLYGVLGLGGALREGALMQDQADAVSLAGSTTLARGMNALVRLNLIMASLVAVLIGLKLAETLLVVGSITLYGLAWPTFGATLPLAGLASEKAVSIHDLYEKAKKTIYPMLEGLHEVEEATSVLVPSLAALESTEAPWNEGVQGLALPGAASLPVAWDEFSVLCGHGARLGTELALLPLDSLTGGHNGFLAPVYEAAGQMGEKLSGYLCGDGKSPPPTHEQKLTVSYPRTADFEACEGGSRAACARSEREMARARVDEGTGNCAAASDCRKGGAYERSASLARKQCDPTEGRPTRWRYQTQTVARSLVAVKAPDGLRWKTTRLRVEESRLESSSNAPCAPGGGVHEDYEREFRGPDGEVQPVCRRVLSPSTLDDRLPSPTSPESSLEVRAIEVTQILSCEREEVRKFELAKKEDRLEGSEAQSPAELESEVELGDEAFQVRGLVHGSAPNFAAEGYVRLPLRGTESGKGSALELPPLFVAQSEYYFDHDGSVPRGEWMWLPRWSARLVRFRLPSRATRAREEARQARRVQSDEAAQARHGATRPGCSPDCGASTPELTRLDSFLVH